MGLKQMTYNHRALRQTTKDDVLAAIRECKQLGEASFLAAHNYGRSARYRVAYDGASYPSKAILGVAAGLTHRQFFGGILHTLTRFKELGFAVLDHGYVIGDLKLRKLAKAMPLVNGQVQRPLAGADAVFASGSNRPGEIAGLAAVGIDIGVAVPQLNEAAREQLKELAGSDLNVFADSGAFGEVCFTKTGPTWPKLISDESWKRRLGVYRELAVALGSQLSVVAPDKVACQRGSIERLRRYREYIGDLQNLGARILVPMQVGDLPAREYAAEITRCIGHNWSPAIPCRKAATTPEQLATLMRELRPAHVHLLGLGPTNKRIAAYTDAVKAGDPEQCYTLDANLITAHSQRSKRIRKYTLGKIMALCLLGLHADWRQGDLTPNQTASMNELAVQITFAPKN